MRVTGPRAEIGACHVYRVSPEGEISIVADDYVKPNGLAFSPDETELCIADTGASHDPDGPKHIRRHLVGPDGTLVWGRGVCGVFSRTF